MSVSTSQVARARKFLLSAGRVAGVDEILAAIGEPAAKRHGLSCMMNEYVRKGMIFTRPEPNTFGLLGRDSQKRSTGMVSPDIRSPANRARQKTFRRILSGIGVPTPAGWVYVRPKTCQWCGYTPRKASKSAIESHHYLGYGDHERDLAVIFVCRCCHRLLEKQEDAVAFIAERYPDVLWMHPNAKRADR